jgi:hypothetical protein
VAVDGQKGSDERVEHWESPPLRLKITNLSRPNGGSLETDQELANHADSRTTRLYDRRATRMELEEIVRIRYSAAHPIQSSSSWCAEKAYRLKKLDHTRHAQETTWANLTSLFFAVKTQLAAYHPMMIFLD